MIEFGDWRLVPRDRLNWELEHRHAASRGKNAGDVSWHPLGRFYQHNTIGEALRFAASRELMERREGEAESIWEALAEYERILQDFADAVRNPSGPRRGPNEGGHD